MRMTYKGLLGILLGLPLGYTALFLIIRFWNEQFNWSQWLYGMTGGMAGICILLLYVRVRSINDKYKKRYKLFLALDILLSGVAAYFILRVPFVVSSELLSINPSFQAMSKSLLGLTTSLGLLFMVRNIEMVVTNQKEHMTLLFFTTILLLSVSVYIVITGII
ncbi:hypothetical protein [Virgibacillus sp. SK37]|uniref:hypothetical protein n=1 Tax=Virgibacillus sp. SK37 TaxID=403957 RepID=UPI0004D102F2|nr:hypothetical protein [Virgibacillus sp. SK37]AIF45319.1 hypothetical protein X953_07005 [Virgibacillus sp. SK37]